MSIDFNSEAADTYIETVRLARDLGAEKNLYYRPPVDRAEAEMAGAVSRRVSRQLFTVVLPMRSAAGTPAVSSLPEARACALCGGVGDVRLWRIVWPSYGAPQRLYRCRGACSHPAA